MWKKVLTYIFLSLLSFNCVLAAVNINTATQKELETLAGIGPVKAKAIINYRRQNGDFMSVKEIMNVPGIGEKTYLQNVNQLSITMPTSTDKNNKQQTKTKKIKYIYLETKDKELH
ncbi:hypothetical protein GKC56_05800 [Neisseriaceae bacterium PsAf]|nr:hypothetical protein [Neisseriaceae bacterium PsAf]